MYLTAEGNLGGLERLRYPWGFPVQRAGALKNIQNTPTVYIIQFQSTSPTLGNEVFASCYLSPSRIYSKYMLNDRSVVNRAENPGREDIDKINNVITEIWELSSIAITKSDRTKLQCSDDIQKSCK